MMPRLHIAARLRWHHVSIKKRKRNERVAKNMLAIVYLLSRFVKDTYWLFGIIRFAWQRGPIDFRSERVHTKENMGSEDEIGAIKATFTVSRKKRRENLSLLNFYLMGVDSLSRANRQQQQPKKKKKKTNLGLLWKVFFFRNIR